MKQKILLVSVLATSLIFATEIANETNLEMKSNLAFDKFDMQVFDINQNLTMTDTNIRVLNDKEMQETKGAALPLWAVVAIATGIANGTWNGIEYSLEIGENWNSVDFMGSVLSGAVIGGGTGALTLVSGPIGGAIWTLDGLALDWVVDHIWQVDPRGVLE